MASGWRWLLIPLLAVPLGLLLFQGLGRDPRLIPSPLIGQPLPALAGPTLDGGSFDSADLGRAPGGGQRLGLVVRAVRGGASAAA